MKESRRRVSRASLLLVMGILSIGMIATGCSQLFGPGTKVRVSGLSLNEASWTTTVGGTTTLVATVLPVNADNKGLSWSSSDPSVASVDSTRLVSALKTGQATITATTVDGGYTVSCLVSVDGTLSVKVLDSLGGTELSGISFELRDDLGATSDQTITGASGSLDLEAARTYSITASKDGYASSTIQGLSLTNSANPIAFYCHVLGMANRPATPVLFSSVKKTANGDGSGGVEIAGSLDTSALPYLVVEVTAGSGVEETAWSGFGIKLAVDALPDGLRGHFGGLSPTRYIKKSEVQTDGSVLTTVLFDLSGLKVASGGHTLTLVAYDVANNRAELSLPFTPASSSVATGGVDINNCNFVKLSASFSAYGETRNYFAMSPLERTAGAIQPSSSLPLRAPRSLAPYKGQTISYKALVSFKFQDRWNFDQPILGFGIERSEDGLTFDRIATVNYGSPYTGVDISTTSTPDLRHRYFDTDPRLVQGQEYFYRVTAFTDSSHSKTSNNAAASISKPFQASLAAPPQQSSVVFDDLAATGPDFQFAISDQELWNPLLSDYFYFALYLADKTGKTLYYGEYEYDFGLGEFQYHDYASGGWIAFGGPGDPASNYMGYTNGVITIKAAVPYLAASNYNDGVALSTSSGTAYEWDIFGDCYDFSQLGASLGMDSVYFEKDYKNGAGTTIGKAFSFSRDPNQGAGALNGRFEFSVQ